MIDPPLNCKGRGEIEKEGWREKGKERKKGRGGREFEKKKKKMFSYEQQK